MQKSNQYSELTELKSGIGVALNAGFSSIKFKMVYRDGLEQKLNSLNFVWGFTSAPLKELFAMCTSCNDYYT